MNSDISKQEDEIYCPECSRPIKKDFTICPYCRTEIKNLGNSEPEIPQNKPKESEDNKPVYVNKKKEIMSVVGVFLGVIVIILLFMTCSGVFSGKSLSTPTTKSEKSLEVDAFVGSQMVVEKNLKSPSSAKFPLIIDSKVSVKKISENKYSVSAYVDSQNSFGAMIRNYYTCTVTLLNDNKYRVEDLKFYE
jgi:hypothetical protein